MNKDITIYHYTFGSETPKVEDRSYYDVPHTVAAHGIPSYEDVMKMLLDGDFKQITLNIGISITHPNDEFSRSVGRQLAMSRMCRRVFNIQSVTFSEPNKASIWLSSDGGATLYLMQIEVKKDSYPRIQDVNSKLLYEYVLEKNFPIRYKY